MRKFEFHKSEPYIYNNETGNKISEYVDRLILTNLADNTFYIDTYYLRTYMVNVVTRCITILHKNNKIKTREDMQKFIDEMMSGILVILTDFQYHQQLYIAVAGFISQTLKLIYTGVDDFCVTPAPIFNHLVTHDSEAPEFNNPLKKGVIAIIEPIILTENQSHVANERDALNIITNINELFNIDNHSFKVYVSVIVSNLWVKDIAGVQMIKNYKIDEIIPDNNINLFDFAEFRQLLLKNEYDIDVVYTNYDEFKEKYDNEDNIDKIDNTDDTEVNMLEEENSYNLLLSLYHISEGIDSIFGILNNTDIVEKNNDITDGSAYIYLHNYMNSNDVGTIDTNELINHVMNKIYDEDESTKKEIKNNQKTIKNDKKSVKNSDNHVINIDKIYTPTFDANGYTKYVGDCLNSETNKFVIDFVSYMKDILSILKKQNHDYKKKMIYEIANKYNNNQNNFTIDKVTKRKNKFNLKIFYKDVELILTIPNKDDIISDIKYKKIID